MTEPSNKTHHLLKDYAQKRRGQAGTPLTLDQVARNRLQLQVIQTYRDPVPPTKPQLFSLVAFWPRVIMGGGLLALVIGGAGLWLRLDAEKERKLAQNQENSVFLLAEKASQRPSPTTNLEAQPVAERVRSFALGEPKEPALAQATVSSNGTSASAGALQEPLSKSGPAIAQTVEMASAKGAAQPAVDAPIFGNASDTHLGLGASTAPGTFTKTGPTTLPLLSQATPAPMLSEQIVPVGLRFQQVDSRAKYRKNLNSPAALPVLTTFQVQRDGENLLVIDADGSVYRGNIQPPGQAGTRAAQGGPSPSARPLAADDASQQSFAFRAAGTNRTLNEVVVFVGDFAAGSNPVGVVQTASQAFTSNNQRAPHSAQQVNLLRVQQGAENNLAQGASSQMSQSNRLLTPGRIQGHASIGGKSEFKIEALQLP